MMLPQILTLVFVALGLIALASIWFARRHAPPNWIVVDGSNVLYWDQNHPKMETVVKVCRALETQGYAPVVWFDANVGYLISDRFLREAELAVRLNLPKTQVFLAGKDTPADPWVLAQARDLKARIVSNDRYREWVAAHPEVEEPGLLLRGRLVDGTVLLDLPKDA
jgi:hypothetical protein